MCLAIRHLCYRFEGSVSPCHFPELLDPSSSRSLAHFYFIFSSCANWQSLVLELRRFLLCANSLSHELTDSEFMCQFTEATLEMRLSSTIPQLHNLYIQEAIQAECETGNIFVSKYGGTTKKHFNLSARTFGSWLF